MKPKITPVPEMEFGLSNLRRYTPPTLPAPPTNDKALIAKHEYQQKLTTASQQLDPSIPSVLLCTVKGTESNWYVFKYCIQYRNKNKKNKSLELKIISY